MNQQNGELDELGELAAALCDGELSPEQAARLEQLVGNSDAARRYFQDHVLLHGELCWDLRSPDEPQAVEPVAVVQAAHVSRPTKRRRLSRIAVAVSLLAALSVGAALTYFAWPVRPASPDVIPVARLDKTQGAEWAEDEKPSEGAGLPAGTNLVLREGFAEIAFDGACVILEAPASFEVQSAGKGRLSRGQLTARVDPKGAGFTICTPNATIVDRGTEFAVVVEQGGVSSIEVFTDSVDVCPDGGAVRLLRSGEALRVSPGTAGSPPRAEPIAAGWRHFARWLGGGIAQFQRIVEADPHLVHRYGFEGATPEAKRRDQRGDLHLGETTMRDGAGGGSIEYASPGPEPHAKAVRPFRASKLGNVRGIGLQSQAAFQPPHGMTIELLLTFSGPAPNEEGLIAAAVATRESRRRAGFYVAAVDQGRLVHMLDGQAAWLDTGVRLAPGDWYYVASTFQTKGDRTIINTYVADLSKKERTLNWVVQNRAALGKPGAGRLGIGSGFDGELSTAYPWAGSLDEVSIYAAVLDRTTLQSHLDAVVSPAAHDGNREQAKQ